MRRVLTSYLAFLMAAAPCLCCCTAARVVAADAPRAEPTACCCHDATDETLSAGPPKPEPQQRCPCRQHSEKPAMVAPAAGIPLLRQSSTDFIPAAVLPVTGVFDVTASAIRGPLRAGPTLTAIDLLNLHHRLRC